MKLLVFFTLFFFCLCSCSSDSPNDTEEIDQSESDSETPLDDSGQDNTEDFIFYGNVTFTTQTEVETFAANNYQEITGNVLIEGNEVYTLNTLINLRSIGGHLIIRDTQLTSLEGFNNISSIGETFNDGNLEIYRNESLISFQGLSSLTSIAGSLEIWSNASLETLQGLNSLERIRTILRVVDNPSLSSTEAIANLQSEVIAINIDLNSVLENLNGLENLKLAVTGALSLQGNNLLSDASSLETVIQDRARAILIGPRYDNCPDGCPDDAVPVLSDLSFLTNLKRVDALIIGEFQGFNLEGLDNLEIVNRITLFGSRSNIQSLSSLSNIESTLSEIRITDQNLITSLEGLDNLSMLDRVTIENNTDLIDFCSISLQLIDAIQNDSNKVSIEGNAYDPGLEELANGDCSL